MSEQSEIVRKLQRIVEEETGLGQLIEKSLRQAKERAQADLNKELYDALPWPTDLPGYCHYLEEFARWIPRQSDNPAWKTSAPQERYAKEVSDRLSHFYWLVDQEVDMDGTAVAQTND
ncbi:MAG TPA: hypothetical protein VFJ09_08370, partial [Nocardioidaceae bacterium]|nr:hypothetical protein [Nocardioidaceae bacterium]